MLGLILAMKKRKKLLSRRVTGYSAKAFGAPDLQISDVDLDRIITSVGYELDVERRELLRKGLSDVLTWATVFYTARETPAPSEIKERVKAIRSSAKTIWSKLGVGKPPEAAWTEIGILSTDINAALWRPLRQAAETWGQQHEPKDFSASEIPKHWPIYNALGPGNVYASNRIREVVYAIAALIAWSDIAVDTILNAPSQKNPKHSPDYVKLWLTRALAEIFRRVYERDPKQTSGGSWLTFLRESLAVGGFAKIGDEAARKLWQRSKSMGPV
jgi:hypothetical protein